MSKTPFNVLHVREYQVNGEKRQQYTNIGVAFEIENGFSVQIAEGLALTGRALILPRKSKEGQQADDMDAAGDFNGSAS